LLEHDSEARDALLVFAGRSYCEGELTKRWLYGVHFKIREFVKDPVKQWNDVGLVTSVHFVHITDTARCNE
jgi:hypothetical protein